VTDDSGVVPDIYVDAVQLSTTPYGVALSLGLNPPHHQGPNAPIARQQAVVRMRLEHAKVIAMLLRKQLKQYERDNGAIPLPPGLYTSLGVAQEDWGL
jgi:hypothetical protein